MNKFKTLIIAFLVGSIALVSCVEDTESTSVTNIRNAKAAQLTALANLANAQAEAELISAKADAMIAEATAAATNQTTAQDKIKFEIQLEQLEAEAELAIARALDAAQKAMIEMQNGANAQTLKVFGDYKVANTKLQDLNKELIQEQFKLIQVVAELIDWEVQKDKNLLGYESTIATQENIIKNLEALPANDLVAARTAAEANDVAQNGINDRLANLNGVFEKSTLELTAKINALYETNTDNQGVFLYGLQQQTIPYKSFVTPATNTVEDKDGNAASLPFTTFTINSKNIEAEVVTRENSVKAKVAVLGKADGTEPNTFYETLKDAKAAEAAAKVIAEKSGATTADQATYIAAIEATGAAQLNVENAIADIASDKEEIAEIQAAVAAFSGKSLEAYEAAIAAVDAAATAEIVADLAVGVVANELISNRLLQVVLNDIVAGITDIPNAIADAEVTISKAMLDIAKEEATSDKEEAVALCEDKIADLKDEVTYQVNIVNVLKSQLDSILTK